MPYIFESPDHGHTIYRREIGSYKRELYHIDDATARELKRISDEILWNEIRAAAETNPALQDAMGRVIMLYNLTKIENDD